MNAYYLIEADPALSAVKQHIEERRAVDLRAGALAKSYGADCMSTDRFNGILLGVTFPYGVHHPEFKKGDRKNGVCRPKKGTDAAKAFAAQVGYESPCATITELFGVPTNVYGEKPNGDTTGRGIGTAFFPCGFLYCSADGPYALYTPDVQAEIAEIEAQGYQVKPTAYDPNLPGCRRILKEEWELIVAQHAAEVAKRKFAAGS